MQPGCTKQRWRGNNPQIRVVSVREIKITNEEDRHSQSSWNRGSESKYISHLICGRFQQCDDIFGLLGE